MRFSYSPILFYWSGDEGMVEFISSFPLAGVLASYGRNIQNFLRHYHPSDGEPYSIAPAALDSFIKSVGNVTLDPPIYQSSAATAASNRSLLFII